MVAGSLVIGIAIASERAACAQDEKPISGRIVHKNGAGVEGVTVWAVGGSEDAPETIAETVTDPQGKFTFAKLPPPADPEFTSFLTLGQVRYDVVARAMDGRLAWIGREASKSEATDIQFHLDEGADVRGQFVDQVGKPIAGVEIAPSIVFRDESPFRAGLATFLPSAVSSSLRVTTAQDGSFVLSRIPRVSFIQAKIRADGLGTMKVAWRPTPQPITIALDRRVGQITGRLKTPDQRRLERACTVVLTRTRGSGNQAGGAQFSIDFERRAAVDRDGSFRFEGILPGQYTLSTDFDPATPFIAWSYPRNPISVGPGRTTEAPEIVLEPVITVSGRVIDSETGKGVQGVSIGGSMFRREQRASATLPRTQTDREGQYRLKSGRGLLHVAMSSVPRPYAIHVPEQDPSLEVGADYTWPDLKLSGAPHWISCS
jgi:hypothetical protein